MTKADFYVGADINARWLGSIGSDGYPADGIIPVEILLQVNVVMFEEMVLDFLSLTKKKDWAAINYDGDEWPWLWPDSRCTDYAYMFHQGLERVVVSNYGKEFFDPIKVLQGEDLNSANLAIGRPVFPKMVRINYGQNIARLV